MAPSDPVQHHFDSQRLRLAYWEWGSTDAPPLLLLHGKRDHARSLDRLAAAFRENYRVVAPDLRGHGDSDWAVGGYYGMSEHIADLLALIDVIGGPVDIVGHSFGSRIALYAAGAFPERVHSVVAIEATVNFAFRGLSRRPLSEPEALRRWIARHEGYAELQPRVYTTREEARERIQLVDSRLDDAFALELARHGAQVGVNYVANADAAEETRDAIHELGGTVVLVKADVSDAEAASDVVETAVEELGKIDILVNNAGVNRDRTIARLSVEEWDEVIQTDLSSMFYCTRAAVPHMREANYGRIINISSVIGQMGNIGQANYGATKAGMIGFTKTAARELARNNITVNAVCPGFVSTEMVTALPENIQDNIKAQIPLGRFGEPEEIAAVVRFLCTEGSWFTGAQLSPNGGQYM